MRRVGTYGVILLSLALGCSSSRSVDDRADASAATTSSVTSVPSPLAHLRTLPAVRDHLAPDVRLARVGSGYRFEGLTPAAHRARFSPLATLIATAPARSNEPAHVGVRGADGRESVWIELLPEDIAAAPVQDAKVEAGAVSFRDPILGQDLIHLVEAARVEELRVFRAPPAERAASGPGASRLVTRHRLTTSAAVQEVRVVDGAVQVVADGRVALESEPIVAWDASGVAIPARVSIEGRTLVVEVDAHGRAFPVTVDPTWKISTTASGSLDWFPAAATLAGSKVRAMQQVYGKLNMVYDPFTDGWTKQADYPNAGNQGHLIPLSTGKVLVAGGTVLWSGNWHYTSTGSYLWDPAAGTAPATAGQLPLAMGPVHGVELSDGKVFAVDGDAVTANTLTWDPTTGTWSSNVVLPTKRYGFSLTLLDSGKVLLAGGRTSIADGVAYVIDPSTASVISTLSMNQKRVSPTALKLPDGKVLLTGSTEGTTAASTAEIYDPGTNAFIAVTAPMTAQRGAHTATLLSNGSVLLAGGTFSATLVSSEIFAPNAATPANGTFTAGPSMTAARAFHAAAPIPGGRVIVFGGLNGSATVNSAEIFTPDPILSSDGTGCPTGVAADGYCCDRACTGTCESCNQPGFLGTCRPVTGAIPSGHAGTCGNYLCGGADATNKGVCATSCLSDAACSTGNYCDTASSKCVPQKTVASGCSRNGECAGGYCVDGVCCGSACSSKTCQACDVAGSVGTCTDVVSGDPHGTHGSCGSYACVSGACSSGLCTGDAQCASKNYCVGGACTTALGQGSTCGRGAECQSGNCVDGYCCDTACSGSCQACDVAGFLGKCTSVASGSPHGARTCSPYAKCTSGACAGSCGTDADCTTGYGCSGSVCVVRKANGAACAVGTECGSGTCVDGVCCNTACGGACQACNLTGKVGTCTAVDGFADPHGKCASGPCGDVCKAGACGFKPAGTACGTSSCASGVLTAQACSGTTETCAAATTAPCAGSLACASATTCKSTCLVDADCTSGVCDATLGKCVAPIDAGPPDTGAPDTFVADTFVADTFVADTFVADTFVADTFVADTFVADTAEDARPVAETGAPKLPATPTVPSEFQRCNKASECPSGNCVEGVCCDTACEGTCHSCALLQSPGKCTQEPVGVDLKNECGPSYSCLGTCGDKGECIGSGTGTQCARNRCTGPSTGIGPAYCAAPGGKCETDGATPFDCGAYACEPAFGACLTTCTGSRDCAPGKICDVAARLCVDPASPPDDGGGCSVSAASAAPGAGEARTGGVLGSLVVALAALGLARRARRRSSGVR